MNPFEWYRGLKIPGPVAKTDPCWIDFDDLNRVCPEATAIARILLRHST